MQTKMTNSKYPHTLDILSGLRMNSSVLDKSIFLTEGPSGKYMSAARGEIMIKFLKKCIERLISFQIYIITI